MQQVRYSKGTSKIRGGENITGHKGKMYVSALCNKEFRGLPDGPVGRNLPVSAEDTGSIPGQGRPHKPQEQLS